MFGFLITLHIIACLFLIAVILLQAGRGGGLSEALGGAAESIFGTRTNVFLTKATAIFATIFILTCIGLTFLSVRKSRSLMEAIPPKETKEVVTQEQKTEEKTQEKEEVKESQEGETKTEK